MGRDTIIVEISTSLGRSGLQDWVIQRVTAVILAIYVAIFFGYFMFHTDFNFMQWHNFFATPWMRYTTLLALISLVAHAWIGVWTVMTDYLKPLWLRFPLQIAFIIALLGYFVWGTQIIWR